MLAIPEELRQTLRHFGQEHVLAWWPKLDRQEQSHLLKQLQAVDFPQLHELFHQQNKTWPLPPLESIQPIRAVDLGHSPAHTKRIGEAMVRRGEVAALVVAGGQGTRLGLPIPKGIYSIGPVTGKTLFQIYAEKISALSRKYSASVPFLIMTSPATDEATRLYFMEKGYFGLPAAEVHFFCQGTMPALDIATGKLLMAGPDRLIASPNGHGGVLAGLRDSGLLQYLADSGIKVIFYFQVDNPLVRIADPLFLGHHSENEAEVSSKVVVKRGPTDKLGNLVEVNGRCCIIEYSDLPERLAHARDPQGNLCFAHGNPAIHLFNVDFLNRVLSNKSSLPFHLARKKVPFLDESGQWIEPTEPNAFKFEMFIFDILPLAERWTAVKTTYHDEFAPLKNDTGMDSPETVRQGISRLAGEWLRQVGVLLPPEHDEEPIPLEIDPHFALDVEELRIKITIGMRIEGPTYLS